MTAIDNQTLADRADAFATSLDRTERVAWLKRQGMTDVLILDVLLSGDDPEPDELIHNEAHRVAIAVSDGELRSTPTWLC